MIGVLVRDQYAIELFRLFADGSQSLRQFTKTESGVNEQTRPLGGDKRCIAATAASQRTDAKARGSLP